MTGKLSSATTLLGPRPKRGGRYRQLPTRRLDYHRQWREMHLHSPTYWQDCHNPQRHRLAMSALQPCARKELWPYSWRMGIARSCKTSTSRLICYRHLKKPSLTHSSWMTLMTKRSLDRVPYARLSSDQKRSLPFALTAKRWATVWPLPLA